MEAIEIVLIVIGIICVIVSIVMDVGSDSDDDKKELSAELTKEQENKIKQQVESIIDDKINGASEKTEASLDKISNTKILEMNEYAESVLGEINRNHNEAVFLYDMLNEKAKELKVTVKDVNITKRQVEKIQAEVKNSDEQVANEQSKATNSGTQTQRREDKPSGASKDVAKERLMALVRKSNERAHMDMSVAGGAAKGGVPEGRNDAGESKNSSVEVKSNVAEEKNGSVEVKSNVAEEKNGTAEAEIENKVAEQVKEKPTKTAAKRSSKTKPSTAKSSTAKSSTAKSSGKSRAKSAADKASAKSTEEIIQSVQFEPGMNNNEKILMLSDTGLAVKDIAKQLNLGVGEVKLVLDLYKGGK